MLARLLLRPRELSRRVDRRRIKRLKSRRHKKGFYYKWLGE